ncbi:thiolase family protein [Cognatishimia activa]|uniref:Putative acetyl-CoA C-acetyltransferase YhfS n=1 Tax=Cognatishimia activa TaxID=1715691 RepID=A0A0P1ISY9_9RHOB|nr:thiolase family protein [Cognatishimia activa]CUI74562.1 Putative acetyl-CoA C-acetyltransferase YhfS [Cognatishimia activa]CUK26681.1 Putative acetyl-CoA C-acetyltransferase YhfS [Cognatishimia activa]
MSHIIAAKRSAVVPRNGAFAQLLPHQIAAPVIQDAIQEASLTPDRVGELILSNALGAGGNQARIAALAAGLPERVGGLSIDRQCAGGLDALILADAMIRSGLHDVVIAGGVESYSRRPLRMHQFSDGRDPEPYDQAPFTPWPDRDPDMATAADTLAQKLGITRDAQDRWAQDSHSKAMSHRADLQHELTVVSDTINDTFTRNLTPRHCEKAKTVAGSITAANMAVAADGAAFVVMVSDRIAKQLARPSLRFSAGVSLGADPEQPGLAPVPAINALCQQTGHGPQSFDHIEIMEAFAVQAIACVQGARLDPSKVNQKGGALARGHPIGASGAILAVRLFHDLSASGQSGLAAIAAAGGLGSAVILEA